MNQKAVLKKEKRLPCDFGGVPIGFDFGCISADCHAVPVLLGPVVWRNGSGSPLLMENEFPALRKMISTPDPNFH